MKNDPNRGVNFAIILIMLFFLNDYVIKIEIKIKNHQPHPEQNLNTVKYQINNFTADVKYCLTSVGF